MIHRSINGACHYAAAALGVDSAGLPCCKAMPGIMGIPIAGMPILSWFQLFGLDCGVVWIVWRWSMIIRSFDAPFHLFTVIAPLRPAHPHARHHAHARQTCHAMQKLSVTLDTQPKPRTVPFQHQYHEWILIVPSSFASMLANKAGAPIPAMPAMALMPIMS